jgi:two-component system, NarL family, nitrate/nitrite response regulator NarL
MGGPRRIRTDVPTAAMKRGSPVEPISVLIVDDHLLFAEVIHRTLEGDGMDVVAAVESGAEALRVFQDERPDLVLLDLTLADQSGLAVGEAITDQSPGTVVVALTAQDDPQLIKQAIRAGFRGYVSKDCGVSQLRGAITQAMAGGVVVALPTNRMGSRSRGSTNDGAALLADQLTQREREVLALLARGTSSVEMARRLDISPNTLRTHVQSVLTKLQVHSRLEAASFAIRNDLVTDDDWRRGSSVRRSQAAS